MKIVGDYAWEIFMQDQRSAQKEFLDTFVTHRHAGKIGWLESIERWSAKHAQQIIVPNEYLASMVEQWGIPRGRIQVIYHLASGLPEVTSSREELHQEQTLSDQTVFLTVVRAVPWKGIDFLLSVLKDLPDSSILVVIGDGPELPHWKTLADTAGLSSRVKFLGRVNHLEIAKWDKIADVFVLASSYEGFPWVVVEAVSAGLPCLLSDRGGNPEAKKLFPEAVEILPWGDEVAWRSALLRPRPRLVPHSASQAMENMTRETIDVLGKFC